MNQAEHRAKDFCVREFAVGWHRIEDGWLHEVARFVPWNSGIPPIQQDPCALFFANPNQRLDSCFALRCNHWPHLHTFVKSIANAQ